MADKKISALTAASTPLAGTEVLPIVQSGSTVKVAVSNLTEGRSVGAAKVNVNTSTEFGLVNVNSTGASDTLMTLGDFTTPGNSVGIYGRVNGSGVFSIKTAGVAIRLSSDASLANPVDILNGNVVPGTAAKGINFTANTPAAGMTSQLLNWYEEGTWTPVLSATTTPPTVSYSNRTGRYTRVGRLVTLHMWMNISSQSGGAGDVTITGLPFASANTSGAPIAAVTVGTYQNINPGVGLIMTPYIGSSSSIINLAASTQIGSGWGNMTTAALGASNINLQLTVTYIV